LLGLTFGLSDLQIFETHLVPLVIGRLILIVFRRLNLEFIILVFLFLLIFLRLWLRLRLFLLFLLVLFIIVFSLILPFELVLSASEAFVHLLYAFSHFCCLFFINSGLEILLDHLRILYPLVHQRFCPAFRDVFGS
jgi:hypothetical protein